VYFYLSFNNQIEKFRGGTKMEVKEIKHLKGHVLKGTISEGEGFVIVEEIDNMQAGPIPAYLDTIKIDQLIEDLQEAKKLIRPLPTMEVIGQ
jgi:hypothetical protein